MSPLIGKADCSQVLEAIDELQRKWQGKLPCLAKQGREPWARSVLFAIEIAGNRIAEECASSPMELSALLDEWELIRNRVEDGTAGESIRGIDFGIRLVIWRVRRCLSRRPQRKPPKSVNGSQPPLDNKGGLRGSAL